MSTPAPEFSRIYSVEHIGRTGAEHIKADKAERTALTARFALVSLDRLESDFTLITEAAGILARGRLRAKLTQTCVASGDPVPETVDTDFLIRFLPESMAGDAEEMELSEEDCDTVFFTGGGIDMGEAVAETLSLSMDPYPRSPDADTFLREKGVKTEEDMSPFAVLKDLKKG